MEESKKKSGMSPSQTGHLETVHAPVADTVTYFAGLDAPVVDTVTYFEGNHGSRA